MEKRRVLIVDDHVILREGITALINNEPDLLVSGEAASASEALAALERGLPDVVLVDIALADSDGLELIQKVKATWPELPQLVLSAHDESRYAERALRAGALGYVMKARSGEVLLRAIREVLAGRIFLSEELQPVLLGRLIRRETGANARPEDLLSERELLVFEKLGSGLGSQEIARILNLSPHTIQRYRENIKRKLGLAGATDLQRAAFEYFYKK